MNCIFNIRELTLTDFFMGSVIILAFQRRSKLICRIFCMLCLFAMFVFSLESCRRDAIDYGKTTSLQLKLTINEKPGVLATKGAIEDFSADVYVMYENTETKFVTFFADPYNEGVYTIDPFRGDQICASYGIPFHIRIEAEIGGLKLRGESEIIVVVDESVIVNIEMYAGAFRIYTRAPRIVDIYGDIVHTGGAIYELQPEQTATYAGVICAPSSSCGSLTEETFTIDNLQTLSGYRTDGRAFGVDDGVNGNALSYLPFEVIFNDLTPNTPYKIRAYAIVNDSVHYGQIVEFSTMRDGPMTVTLSATDVTMNSARVNAEILTLGDDVYERGFIISRNKYLSSPETIPCGSGSGTFNAEVAGLNPCTRIFYKAYATTSYGTYYGELSSFATYDVMIDNRDGNEYLYVPLGNQIWMSENMRYLPQVNLMNDGSEDSGSENEPHYYVYSYSGTSVDEAKSLTLSQALGDVPAGTNMYSRFGVLYDYNAAQSACPAGWHLPTDGEWTRLEVYLQNNGFNSNHSFDCDYNRATNNYTAKSLSSNSMWYSSDIAGAVGNRLDQNNSSGMALYPAGYRSSTGGFYGLSSDSYCWSATAGADGNAIGRSYGSDNVGQISGEYLNSEGLSVRCVKD